MLLRSRAGAVRGWGFWYRNPEEAFDVQSWRRFVRRLQLQDIGTGNLLVDASAGGSVLWSPRKRGHITNAVLPAPGRPWSLGSVAASDAAGQGPEATGDIGMLRLDEPQRPPYIILQRTDDELALGFVYGGTRAPRCQGRVYPTAEVLEVARKTPELIDAAIVLDRDGRFAQPVRVLVGFTGATRLTTNDERALAKRIGHALGAAFVPDRVHLVPLHPRLLDGEIDSRWCESQQVAGMFHHRPRKPIYQLITLMRRALQLEPEEKS
jgi:hypothetical protein